MLGAPREKPEEPELLAFWSGLELLQLVLKEAGIPEGRNLEIVGYQSQTLLILCSVFYQIVRSLRSQSLIQGGTCLWIIL